ncbi:hypothetical protein SVAN01_11988 [Stagonosporopsis vannaccii]|nr:hypothetical protein SVAN01_11988 [Stagonosporopsis vannaccii]
MAHAQIYPQDLNGRIIRLLNVEPGDVESRLHCSLKETSLDDTSISYYALSYCWGAGHPPVEITCNSHSLLITPSLHSALLEYRRRGVNMPLWVDAVCINQLSIPERTAQVRMMQAIYSNAACVVVWLGEAEATDGPALEVLKAINAPWASICDPQGRNIPIFTGQNNANHDATVAARVSDKGFDALAAFLLRPWFSRMWIVQELVCASELTIWCGQDTLNEGFPVLEAAARLFMLYNCNVKVQLATISMEDKEAQGIGRSKMMCAGRLWGFKTFKDKGFSGILWLLLITRYFDATDPRDKIFALVGLASNVSEGLVDYSKSYKDIVQDLSHMFLDNRIPTTSGSVLDLWSCITRDEKDDLSGPSWVVDWLKLSNSLYTPMMTQYESEKPTIQRVPEIQFSKAEGDATFHVRGSVFDTITHIVSSPVAMRELVPQSELNTSQHLPGFLKWHTEAIMTVATASTDQDTIYRATGESLYDAFWRTLCCNRSALRPSTPPVDDSSYAAWKRLLDLHQELINMETMFRRVGKRQTTILCSTAFVVLTGLTYHFRRQKFLLVALPLSLPPLIKWINQAFDAALQILVYGLYKQYAQQSMQTQLDQRDFENSHSQWTQGRQFGVTTQGLMGWVPLAARVGDNIGLFAGCRVPFVMRKWEDGWKVVGDAYVHGVMNGEGEASEGEMLKIF